MAQPEPWLRGPIGEVPRHLQPVFHSFLQVREDLALHTQGISDGQVWHAAPPLPPLGFQLRHMAGSVDRLVTYLMGGELSSGQMTFLKTEQEPGAGLEELLRGLSEALTDAEQRIRGISEAELYDPRHIGKKRLPSTVLGLLVHVAEHTQRHLGQAITTAKLLRSGTA